MSTFGSIIFELGPIILGLISLILIKGKTSFIKFNKEIVIAFLIGCIVHPWFCTAFSSFFEYKV